MLNVKLEDPDKYEYPYSIYSGSVTGYFGVTEIEQGEMKAGKRVFEVPKASVGMVYVLLVD